jgi:hypothetical protein
MASVAGLCDIDTAPEAAGGLLSLTGGVEQSGVPAAGIAGIPRAVLGKISVVSSDKLDARVELAKACVEVAGAATRVLAS